MQAVSKLHKVLGRKQTCFQPNMSSGPSELLLYLLSSYNQPVKLLRLVTAARVIISKLPIGYEGLSISCLRSAVCICRKMLGYSKTAYLSLNPIITCMHNSAGRGVVSLWIIPPNFRGLQKSYNICNRVLGLTINLLTL